MTVFDFNAIVQPNRRQMMCGSAALLAVASGGCALTQNKAASSRSTARYVNIDGNRVYIEERGSGLPIIMAAGGQNRVETLRPLAEKLANRYHVITWDRANLGRADVVFDKPRDLDLWASQLAGLIKTLGVGPAYLIGASSAARVAYTAALNYPQLTRGCLTYLTTGGGGIEARLAQRYYYDYADTAETKGMSAIIDSDFWAQRIAQNPDNATRLAAIPASDFAAVMRRWGDAMYDTDVMIGLPPEACAKIKAAGTPMGITQGCAEATVHRRDRSELYAKLTGATLIPTPPLYCEEEDSGVSYMSLIDRPEVPESGPFRAYEMMSCLPDVIETFITQTEVGYSARGLGRSAFSFNI